MGYKTGSLHTMALFYTCDIYVFTMNGKVIKKHTYMLSFFQAYAQAP